MAGLPSQIGYGGWQKIHYAVPQWPLFNNTDISNTLQIIFIHTFSIFYWQMLAVSFVRMSVGGI